MAEEVLVFDFEMAEREAEDEFYNRFAPLATMSDAHSEWHRNTGLEYGCPQDACHPPEPDWVTPTQSGVKCGNKSGPHFEGWEHHASAADVRECYEMSGHFLSGVP